MGRQAYMNRLALGRSPYEAPEPSEQLQRRSASAVEADGYVQEYDERGHPTNPASNRLGRELRRAKNDVLSTMGIVVSGEVGNMGVFREKQKTNAVIAENDYGSYLATLDQALNFFGSWWTSSLGARIQTFRSYTHMPLLQLIRTEIQEFGLSNFYFAGSPAWMAASSVSMLRQYVVPSLDFLQNLIIGNMADGLPSRFVKCIFSMLRKVAPVIYFAFLEQVYMLSILQALQLVPMSTFPGLRFFVPFTSNSLIRLPTVPTDLSPRSLAHFVLQLAGAPYMLLFYNFSLRPFVEARLYHILRRHLPRPDHPDEVSVKVALEHDWAEWTVPTLGRWSQEEVARRSFTLAEDIRYEMTMWWNWVRSWFGWKDYQRSSSYIGITNSARRERLESIRSRIEQLQRELGYTGSRPRPARSRRRASISFTHQERTGRSAARSSQSRSESTATPDPQSLLMDQDLPDWGLTQSPTQITPDSSDWLQSPVQTGMNSASRDSTDTGPRTGTEEDREHTGGPYSRSNSLYSVASSSDSSPPNSPRVRASLVHQSSDVITMQLELLSTRQHEGNESSQRAGNGQQQNLFNRSVTSERTPGHRPDHIRRADEAAATQTVFDEVPRETSAPENGDHLVESTAIFPDAVESPPPGTIDNNDADGEPSSDSEPEDDLGAITGTNAIPEDGRRGRLQSSVTESNNVQATSATLDRTKKTRHRVTVLSTHPVVALATRLASLGTALIFLPLESLYLRSLARTYLSSPLPLVLHPYSSTRSISDIRGLGELFGGGNAADMGAYIGKMMMVLGLQGAVSMAILRLSSAATLGLGRKRFGWGSL